MDWRSKLEYIESPCPVHITYCSSVAFCPSPDPLVLRSLTPGEPPSRPLAPLTHSHRTAGREKGHPVITTERIKMHTSIISHPSVPSSSIDQRLAMPFLLSQRHDPTSIAVIASDYQVTASCRLASNDLPDQYVYFLSLGLASIFSRLRLNPPFPFLSPIFGMRLPPVLNIFFCGLITGASDVLALLALGPSVSSRLAFRSIKGARFSLSSSSSSVSACFRFLFDIPCGMAGRSSELPKDTETGVGKPLGRTWRIVAP